MIERNHDDGGRTDPRPPSPPSPKDPAAAPGEPRTGGGALALRYALGTCLGIALSGLVIWGVTARVCADLRDSGRRKVADLAATVAVSIPAEEHAALRGPGDESSALYHELRGHLLAICRANPEVHNIYTLIPGESPDHWHFVVDAGADPLAPRAMGDPLPSTSFGEREQAFGEPAADPQPTREPWGSRLSGYAAFRDAAGAPRGIVRVDVNADTVLRREREFGRQAAAAFAIVTLLIGLLGRDRYEKRRAERERARNLQTRLTLYRVADVMARAKDEEELARNSLDAMAEATGIAHWAIFRRDPDDGSLRLFASRGLPASARAELEPDGVGPDAESPVARAAWHGEPVIARDPSDMPAYAFAAPLDGLGARPAAVAIPLCEHGEPVAVLQGFIPRSRPFGAEDLTLCRWIASQILHGLRRLQLERRDQLLASFMMSTGEIVLGFDLDGVVSYVNPAGERALGRPLHEVASRSIDHFVSPSGSGEASFFETVRSGGSFAGDVWLRRANGSRFPCEVTVSRAVDREGDRTAHVLVGRDVTERRERDEELRSRSEQLLLVNEQLQFANVGLEEANRMKNEFLASTSHELRTPLNAVIGFSTLVEQGMVESVEESRALARSIRESAEHLLRVINDILDLAKVESGRFQVEMAIADLAPLIHATAGALRGTAERKGLVLRVELGEETLPMYLDEARMRQVLMNLLGNALKFTDEGEVRLRAYRDGESGEIRIVVEDTGIGIAAEDIPKLFTKFMQVDGSYKRRHQGTGLGLAITQSLVEKMNGRITITSEGLGMGTRLALAFPAAESSAPAPGAGADPDETAAVAPAGREVAAGPEAGGPWTGRS